MVCIYTQKPKVLPQQTVAQMNAATDLLVPAASMHHPGQGKSYIN